MTDSYIYVLTALLPLTASLLILQVNPYHALVIRGILGAVAALVYTVLGAADVALTEALVGTLLAVTLYGVTVRSSLVFRLGVLKATLEEEKQPSTQISQFRQLMSNLRTIFGKHHMQVECISYANRADLNQALIDKEIHATYAQVETPENQISSNYVMNIRLHRLYEILQVEQISSPIWLTCGGTSIDVAASPSNSLKPGEVHL